MAETIRIAFPTNDRIHVEEHFGHAREFAFVNVENGKAGDPEYIAPPPHAPGVIPQFVGDQGAGVIITGGMGQMAVNLFKQQGIEVILGAQGTIQDTLSVFLEGTLESTGPVCDHQH
ncbi:MAG: NifB/NifX family molybdenum-iron cluster-binding protein [Spirochaetales bacterium]|nr:NifB/NifX family molybdenum-iron cluster-binding protein [Spirochaetales bacterium]